jgi:hypothetical protein
MQHHCRTLTWSKRPQVCSIYIHTSRMYICMYTNLFLILAARSNYASFLAHMLVHMYICGHDFVAEFKKLSQCSRIVIVFYWEKLMLQKRVEQYPVEQTHPETFFWRVNWISEFWNCAIRVPSQDQTIERRDSLEMAGKWILKNNKTKNSCSPNCVWGRTK